MKEWRKVTFMSTIATSRRWTYPNTFFCFQKRAILKFPEVQLNFYLVNGLLKLIFHTNQYNAWYIVLYAEKAWNKRMIINFDIWSTVVIMFIMFAMVNMVARSSKSPIVS